MCLVMDVILMSYKGRDEENQKNMFILNLNKLKNVFNCIITYCGTSIKRVDV